MGTRDTELTQKIRKALVKDGSLSVNAHNVKIITTNGHVTLKGPVSSVREKDEVTELARSIAGKNFVTDELDVLKSE
jgi:osmotically-inducible protein OsmY